MIRARHSFDVLVVSLPCRSVVRIPEGELNRAICRSRWLFTLFHSALNWSTGSILALESKRWRPLYCLRGALEAMIGAEPCFRLSYDRQCGGLALLSIFPGAGLLHQASEVRVVRGR